MSIFVPDSESPVNSNNNVSYGYYGESSPDNTISLRLGSFNPNYGSVVIDGNNTDPSITGLVFSYDNNQPVASRITNNLTDSPNKLLTNMSNPTTAPDSYPREELFGKQDTFQYVYNNNPRKDKIGVF
jgi:hypothetical protein